MGIRENILAIKKELPDTITIVAVSKTFGVKEIEEAIAAGVEIFGENYVQEAEEKWKILGNKVQWHFVGDLQKNKINRALKIFDMFESINSIEIAKELSKRAEKDIPILLEVNICRDEKKKGFFEEQLIDAIKEISALSHIKIQGLMTIGKYFNDPEDMQPYFKRMKELFDEIASMNISHVEMKHLSMGMSADYVMAAIEGSTMVRIGTAIFGERSEK